jgi:signal transduction histidine kinase
MFRNLAFVPIGLLALSNGAVAEAARYGTAEEAKAMLQRAVAALRADKAQALKMFNDDQGGFRDKDLYVFCVNAANGVQTAHPIQRSGNLMDVKDKNGFAFGKEIMTKAAEGAITEVTYVWSRPGSDAPATKVSFVTKVADQICGVGYYK